MSKVAKRHILSFNPIYKTHWIYDHFFKPINWSESQKEYQDDHLSILKTTYKDNQWLMPDDVYALENEGMRILQAGIHRWRLGEYLGMRF